MGNRNLILIFFSFLFPLLVHAQYKIYYVPIDVETFVPVSLEEIESQAHFIFEYKSDFLDQLFLEKNNKSTNPVLSTGVNLRARVIRLKDKQTVYLNKPKQLLPLD